MPLTTGEKTKQARVDSWDSAIREALLESKLSRTDDMCQVETKAVKSHKFFDMTETIATPSGRNPEAPNTPNTGGEKARMDSKGAEIYGIPVSAGWYTVKNKFFEDDINEMEISINAPVADRQSRAMILRKDIIYMNSLEKAFTGYDLEIAEGVTKNIKIPDTNKFDCKGGFSFDVFQKALVAATTAASASNLKIKIFMQTGDQDILINEPKILSNEYFSKKILERNTLDKLDWNSSTKVEVFPDLDSELYGKKKIWTEGRIYIAIERMVGKLDNPRTVKGQIVDLPDDDLVMYKSKFASGCGVITPKGIFVVTYTPGEAVQQSKLTLDQALPQIPMAMATGTQDIDKLIELEKIKATNLEKSIELEKLKNVSLGVAENPVTISEDTEKPKTKQK